MNQNKPKMALKIAIAPKKRSLFSCSFQNKPKQTDLFHNEPKQTKNGLKNSNSTQKNALFPAAVSDTNQKNQIFFQNEPKQTENGLKIINSTQKTLSFRKKNSSTFWID